MTSTYGSISRQFILIFFLLLQISFSAIISDNLIINEKQSQSLQLESSTNPPNCVKIDPQNTSVCLKCSKNYDLTMGLCIDSKCNIYSQQLKKCLDNVIKTELKKLQQIFKVKNINEEKDKVEKNQIKKEQQDNQLLVLSDTIDLGLPVSSSPLGEIIFQRKSKLNQKIQNQNQEKKNDTNKIDLINRVENSQKIGLEQQVNQNQEKKIEIIENKNQISNKQQVASGQNDQKVQQISQKSSQSETNSKNKNRR